MPAGLDAFFARLIAVMERPSITSGSLRATFLNSVATRRTAIPTRCDPCPGKRNASFS
jgi:hypothetical protein